MGASSFLLWGFLAGKSPKPLASWRATLYTNDGLLSVWDGPGQYVQTGSMAGSTQNTPTGGNAYDDE